MQCSHITVDTQGICVKCGTKKQTDADIKKKLYDALVEEIAKNNFYWQICIDESGIDLDGVVFEPSEKDLQDARDSIKEWYDIEITE